MIETPPDTQVEAPTFLLRTRVNGRAVEVRIEPRETLADVLRERLRLTGTKVSCDVQVCGACTVLVDGLPVSACTSLAYEARDRDVLTVEGLAASADRRPPSGLPGEQHGPESGDPPAATDRLQPTGAPVNAAASLGQAAGPDRLHPLQAAFIAENGFQCGFCTPGMLLAAKSLLDVRPRATEEEILTYMEGNLCRCTGYRPIVTAIQRAQTTLLAQPDATAPSTGTQD